MDDAWFVHVWSRGGGLRQRGGRFGVEEIPLENTCTSELYEPGAPDAEDVPIHSATVSVPPKPPHPPPKRPREEVAANRTYGQEVPGVDFPDGDLATLEPTAPAAAPSATATRRLSPAAPTRTACRGRRIG